MPLLPLSPRPALYALSWLTDFISMLLIFALTRYLAEQDGNLIHLGILGACGSFTFAVAAAVCGHLSDRLGRRRLIALGAIVFAVACGLALHSLAIPLIYLEAALAGLATALVFPAVIALLSTSQAPVGTERSSTRPLMLFCLSWNLGVVTGNVSGGWLFYLDAQLPFQLGAILAGCHLLLNLASRPRATGEAAAPLPDPARASRNPSEEAPPAPVLRFFAFVGWLANISGAFAMSLIYYVLPQVVTDLGISAPVHGAVVMTARITVVATYLLLHFTTFWRYRIIPGLVAQATAIGGLALLSSANTVPLLTLGVMLVGTMMGYNYFSSIFYSTTGFREGRRGLASGLHEATLTIGFTIGAMGGGLLGSALGVRVPFLVCIATSGIAMLLQLVGYLRFRRRAGGSLPTGRYIR